MLHGPCKGQGQEKAKEIYYLIICNGVILSKLVSNVKLNRQYFQQHKCQTIMMSPPHCHCSPMPSLHSQSLLLLVHRALLSSEHAAPRHHAHQQQQSGAVHPLSPHTNTLLQPSVLGFPLAAWGQAGSASRRQEVSCIFVRHSFTLLKFS